MTLEANLKICRELLTDYCRLKSVSKETEEEYLSEFEYSVAFFQKAVGRGVLCAIMQKDDHAAFKRLPQSLTIYRGYYELKTRNGISWSLSRLVAEGFAYRGPSGTEELPPRVVAGKCSLKHVLAYTNEAGEQEIIINPGKVKNIRNIEVREIPVYPVIAEPLDTLLAQRSPRKTRAHKTPAKERRK